MADLTDVENALVNVAAMALYPNGNPAPGQAFAPSVTTDSVRIYPGWPNSAALDADLAKGIVNISVFPPPGSERNTTRFPKEWQESIAPAVSVTAAVVGNAVTLGGTLGGTQYVTILIGQRKVYSYAIGSNDTFESVASALAALVAVDFPATASGRVITIITSAVIVARVGSTGTSWMELRRQQRLFMVSIFAPSPAVRTRVAKVVDTAFAAIERMTLPDNSSARLIYESTVEADEGQRVKLYRRTLNFTIEYATAVTAQDYQITSFGQTVQGGVSPADTPIQNVHSVPIFPTNE